MKKTEITWVQSLKRVTLTYCMHQEGEKGDVREVSFYFPAQK